MRTLALPALVLSFVLGGCAGSPLRTDAGGIRVSCLDLAGKRQQDLIQGLKSSPEAITMPELEAMDDLSNDRAVVSITYLNMYETVRYGQDMQMVGMSWSQARAKAPGRSDAAFEAERTRQPVLRATSDARYDELAYPLTSGDELEGTLSLFVAHGSCGNPYAPAPKSPVDFAPSRARGGD